MYIYPQTRVSSFPWLVSVARVNEQRTTGFTRVLKAPGTELCQSACGVVNEQKIFCSHQCSSEGSVNKFRAYIYYIIYYIYILYILYIIYIYNIKSVRDLWGVKLAKTEYLPTTFARRLLPGRIICRFISICELCLQLENLTSYKWCF